MPSIIPDDIFDPIAEGFRDQLEQAGQDTRLISNRDLVTRIGDSIKNSGRTNDCLLYTSPSPRDCRLSRMPSSA